MRETSVATENAVYQSGTSCARFSCSQTLRKIESCWHKEPHDCRIMRKLRPRKKMPDHWSHSNTYGELIRQEDLRTRNVHGEPGAKTPSPPT
ncbi:uncharacterized protein WM277_019017 isoform 2-T2 [Molossus nigricans]